MEKWIEILTNFAANAGKELVIALLIFLIGRIIIKNVISRLKKSKVIQGLDPTAGTFILNLVKIALYAVMVAAIVKRLGVDTSSIVALLASCGVAVGLALQGALANLAGGIMMLIFRPFNVGDYIIAAGEEGVVKEINMIYTILLTVDNKKVTIPNGTMMNANIVNATCEDLRRVDLTFNISGVNEIATVQQVILDAIAKNKKALIDPAPFVSPLAGIPGGMEYTVRVWCNSADYWDAYFTLTQEIATALGNAGIGGPVPASQVTVQGN